MLRLRVRSPSAPLVCQFDYPPNLPLRFRPPASVSAGAANRPVIQLSRFFLESFAGANYYPGKCISRSRLTSPRRGSVSGFRFPRRSGLGGTMRAASAVSRGRSLALLLPALACAACSGKDTLHEVHGTVLAKKAPAKGVTVTFHPKGKSDINIVRPVGFTDESGRSTPTTGDRDGAVAGDYVVTFIWPEEVKAKQGFSTESPDTGRDRLDHAFADPKKSSFNVQIKRGKNELEPFHLP